ncbi:hypothetical protein BegalDRAFT_3006 [Beggiatoa alba B18LD]|uniref:PEGA domain-containing protein n=1 Tax=Beggiatoa alba B18LD TaxID=395493 RepID=I3CJP0_9GAMM|nr:hypothetical protein [Beggiatoa alba]EIJ43833.1 hypothetical protein BegalDRAFT_3006 [Beggiatoa alba B18LD]
MPRKLLTIVGLGFLAYFFLLNAATADEYYKLYINTTPTDAKISIRNILPKFKQGIALVAGRYEIVITHKDYQSYKTWIDLKEQTTLNIQLLPSQRPDNHYTLNLSVNPSDAEIQLMDVNQQSIPFSMGMWLPPNQYLLRVFKKGYAEQQQWIRIDDQDLQLTIDLTSPALAPDTAESPIRYPLHIYVQPSQATITLINQERSFQQGMLLKSGRYLLQITQPDYTTRQEWIEIFDEGLTLNVTLSKPKMCFAHGDEYLVLEFFGDVVEGTYSTATGQYIRLKGAQQTRSPEIKALAIFTKDKIQRESNVMLFWQTGNLLLKMNGKQSFFTAITCAQNP